MYKYIQSNTLSCNKELEALVSQFPLGVLNNLVMTEQIRICECSELLCTIRNGDEMDSERIGKTYMDNFRE